MAPEAHVAVGHIGSAILTAVSDQRVQIALDVKEHFRDAPRGELFRQPHQRPRFAASLDAKEVNTRPHNVVAFQYQVRREADRMAHDLRDDRRAKRPAWRCGCRWEVSLSDEHGVLASEG